MLTLETKSLRTFAALTMAAAMAACAGGGGGEAAPVVAVEGEPLDPVQAATDDLVAGTIAPALPDQGLRQFAITASDAIVLAEQAGDDLLIALIEAGELAQAGNTDPAAYQDVLTNGANRIQADVTAAATTAASAVLQLSGGNPLTGPALDLVAVLMRLGNVANDPEAATDPQLYLDAVNDVVSVLMSVQPEDLISQLPDPGAIGDLPPGDADAVTGALQTVLDMLLAGFEQGQGIADGILGMADGTPAEALVGPVRDLLAMLEGMIPGIDEGLPGLDGLGGLGDLGGLPVDPGQLAIVTDALQGAIDMLQLGDSPLGDAEDALGPLQAVLGPLQDILAPAACGLLPQLPICN